MRGPVAEFRAGSSISMLLAHPGRGRQRHCAVCCGRMVAFMAFHLIITVLRRHAAPFTLSLIRDRVFRQPRAVG